MSLIDSNAFYGGTTGAIRGDTDCPHVSNPGHVVYNIYGSSAFLRQILQGVGKMQQKEYTAMLVFNQVVIINRQLIFQHNYSYKASLQ